VGTGSNQTDYEELPAIQERLEQRQCKPGEQYVEAGYMSGPNLAHSQTLKIDRIGPLPTVVTPQDLLPDGITQAQFQVDTNRNSLTCPQGYTARDPVPVGNSRRFQFPKRICAACQLLSRLYWQERQNDRDQRSLRIGATGACTVKDRNVQTGLSPAS
jgi:hypothetical protein